MAVALIDILAPAADEDDWMDAVEVLESMSLKKWTPLLWLLILALIGWLLADRLRQVELEEVLEQLRALPPHIVLAGVLCSAGVYAAVGLYEGLAVRMATGRRSILHPLRTALVANPIGRAVGAAMVSGGALRYRMYTAAGLSAKQIAAVIVLAAMPYVLAVGWLVDLSLVLNSQQASRTLHVSATLLTALGVVGLFKDVGWLIFVAKRTAPIYIRGLRLHLPTLRDSFVQIAFGLAEISLMTAILYLFMPPELGMSWPSFIGIYCIAFIAGQISNIPAGIGVLEAALLLMLPHVPPGKLLGAVLAYRAVYELLPLLLAVLLLLTYETTHPAGVLRRRS